MTQTISNQTMTAAGDVTLYVKYFYEPGADTTDPAASFTEVPSLTREGLNTVGLRTVGLRGGHSPSHRPYISVVRTVTYPADSMDVRMARSNDRAFNRA
jgi:hypothetical protein